MTVETLAFQFKHDYSLAREGIEVPINLKYGGRDVRLVAKVDTGAAFPIFPREYAEQLGIDVESGRRETVRTTTGRFEVYGHAVSMSCFDWEFETTVYFAASPDFPRNVVGRSGWLQHFRLGIIDHDAILLLSRYDDDPAG